MLSIEMIRQTSPNKVATTIRWILAIMFVMTVVMKLVVPALAEAFSGQLIASGLPLYTVSFWSVPFVEISVGVVMALGLYARLAALVIIAIMTVATYCSYRGCRPIAVSTATERTDHSAGRHHFVFLCHLERRRSGWQRSDCEPKAMKETSPWGHG